jgi:hypothetical protein
MSEVQFIGLALLVSVGGMMLFAFSIEAHWRQVFGERPRPFALRIGLRLAGAAMLAGSLMLCAAANPVTMAMLVWPMLLTVAAALVAAGLTLHARTTRANKVIVK